MGRAGCELHPAQHGAIAAGAHDEVVVVGEVKTKFVMDRDHSFDSTRFGASS